MVRNHLQVQKSNDNHQKLRASPESVYVTHESTEVIKDQNTELKIILLSETSHAFSLMREEGTNKNRKLKGKNGKKNRKGVEIENWG